MVDLFRINPILEVPAYSLADAASYARVPYQTLRYWTGGKEGTPPLIHLPQKQQLSFANLIECYVLNGFRTVYELKIQSVRRALETLHKLQPCKHPLLETQFSTDGIDLFLDGAGETINLSKGGQTAMKEILRAYLHRIVWAEPGIAKLYPLVVKNTPDEPRLISIVPTVAFGRSVIDGTGISTAVVAARFNARETIQALADEYGRSATDIEEAIRWETIRQAAAA